MVYIPLLCLLFSLARLSYAAKLVNPKRCARGCRVDSDCVSNAECRYLDNWQECGYCICSDGFAPKGRRCIGVGGYHKTSMSAVTYTADPPTYSTSTEWTPVTDASTPWTVPTRAWPTTQGPPPTPDPLYCPAYNCAPIRHIESIDADPFQIRTAIVNPNDVPAGCQRRLVTEARPCNVQGGGSCYGEYCLTVWPGNDYCICPYYTIDRLCAIEKPGSCNSATGIVPSGAVQLWNTRLRNKNNKEHGSVYARHFAASLSDCIKLCQWPTDQCRSVNYGPISGSNVCELMSIVATPTSFLSSWLENAPGWQYAQVTPNVY